MSKMDALRAMREAKYEAARAGRSGSAATPRTRPPVAPRTSQKAAPAATDEPKAETDGLCGHRNMSGRTCTREHGHAAKSHRYS